MSTSAEGSVKGKKDGRKRIFTLSTSKNALQNSSSTHFRWRDVGRLVDHQPLDLMEHRRVGLVGVVPVGAARDDHPDRRLPASCMVRICTGDVCVRSTLRSPFSFGARKKVSCISRAGWPGGKLSAVKL